ncbi:hypothetical protein BDF19DRAFT_227160 [Syncephalis fuscata]|nr:hypothetical protein BDF19DRAFT_227160 [Syncephalis fuscata]
MMQSTIAIVISYTRLLTQGIIIVGFIYYGITFWLKQDTLIASSAVKHALSLVTKICVLFSLGFLMVFVVNMMEIGETWRYGVKAELLSLVLYNMSHFLRNSVLLFFIGLRPKSGSQPKDNTAVIMDNRDNIETLVQSTNTKHTAYVGALMSSNVDPDAHSTFEESAYDNKTTKCS